MGGLVDGEEQSGDEETIRSGGESLPSEFFLPPDSSAESWDLESAEAAGLLLFFPLPTRKSMENPIRGRWLDALDGFLASATVDAARGIILSIPEFLTQQHHCQQSIPHIAHTHTHAMKKKQKKQTNKNTIPAGSTRAREENQTKTKTKQKKNKTIKRGCS